MYINAHKLVAIIAASSARFALVNGQTWSECNPMKTTCPPDPALSGNYEHTFGGEAPSFKAVGSKEMIKYQSDGAHFIVEKTNDSPTITSNFYIMWGRLDVTLRAAPGHGIVSSLVFQSDTLDEIDWEWIGSDQGQAQSNYFGKGNTETYDRGAFHPVNHQEFHDYGVEWTPQFINWMIDGKVVRTLTPNQVKGDFYPQTPMQIKIGSWSAGDPSNAPGVIQWSQGPTDYKAGPFHMIVKDIKVMDYSTGKFYVYTDKSGSAASIKSDGGKIDSGPSDKVADPVAPKENPNQPTSTYKAPVNPGRQSSTATSTKTTNPGSYNSANPDKGSSSTPTNSSSYSGSGSGQQLVETGPGKNGNSAPDSRGSGHNMNILPIPLLALAGLVGVGLVL